MKRKYWIKPTKKGYILSPDLLKLLTGWDSGRCCDTDSCNDGKGKCNGSCERKGKKK